MTEKEFIKLYLAASEETKTIIKTLLADQETEKQKDSEKEQNKK